MSNANLLITVSVAAVNQNAWPMPNAISAEYTQELDKAGAISVTLPVDGRVKSLLSNDRWVNITILNSDASPLANIYRFSGLIQTLSTDSQDGKPIYRAEGTDLLGLLNYSNTGYNAIYDNETVETTIIGNDTTLNSLLYGTGFVRGTVTIDPTVATQTIKYNGETILSALTNLCTQIGHHFRVTSPSTLSLDVGVFGSASTCRLINVDGARYGQDTAYTGIYGNITVSYISADIENWMYPVGKDSFDLRDAPQTLTDIYVSAAIGTQGRFTDTDDTAAAGQKVIPCTSTTGFLADCQVWIGDSDDWTADHEYATITSVDAGVSITINSDLVNTYAAGVDVIQSPQFYIWDTTSIATHGERKSCPQFGWIGPGDTAANATIQSQAAETLYRATKARMARYKDTYEQYTIGDVYNLPPDLLPGQKIHLVYVGTVNGVQFAYIDDDYYVLKITRRWEGSGAGGTRGVCTLEVANVARPAPNNQNLIIYNLDSNRWIGM